MMDLDLRKIKAVGSFGRGGIVLVVMLAVMAIAWVVFG